MATASPVSKFPLDDGHRAFLPIILREFSALFKNMRLGLIHFTHGQIHTTRKKNLRELHLSQNIFIRVCLYHISEYLTRGWEKKGTKLCYHPTPRTKSNGNSHNHVLPPPAHTHFFTYRRNRLTRAPFVALILVWKSRTQGDTAWAFLSRESLQGLH